MKMLFCVKSLVVNYKSAFSTENWVVKSV
jgi:hypothetical protein